MACWQSLSNSISQPSVSYAHCHHVCKDTGNKARQSDSEYRPAGGADCPVDSHTWRGLPGGRGGNSWRAYGRQADSVNSIASLAQGPVVRTSPPLLSQPGKGQQHHRPDTWSGSQLDR